MQKPENEAARLRVLQELRILDTPRERTFDDLAFLAAQVCDTPIALVTFVDGSRQWFKARVGLETTETPRDVAFCAHAILQDDIFEVSDSHKDERFANNPLVTGHPDVRFYAGAPLITSDGFALGTVCAIDHRPRELTPGQRESLRALSRLIVAKLEQRSHSEESGNE
ncbi:MAG TPA: GAF domain-containing protein [Thermoanaerobaculia bacterium]|nr:GAF domain-containing protein [Thermoanaerobaculia bacterium]